MDPAGWLKEKSAEAEGVHLDSSIYHPMMTLEINASPYEPGSYMIDKLGTHIPFLFYCEYHVEQ